jgi:hypothetical protein
MENAHLRLGLLEYVRFTERVSTRIRLRVDRYMGEDRQAHLLSVFGSVHPYKKRGSRFTYFAIPPQ